MISILAYFLYLLSVVFFFSFSTPYMTWIFMELNLLIYSGFIFYDQGLFSSDDSSAKCLFYFMIQSIGSLLFLSGIYFNSAFAESFSLSFLIYLAIFLKLGFFPLHAWFLKLSSSISTMSFFFLMTFQKVPLLFMIYNLKDPFLTSLFLFNMVAGAGYLGVLDNITMKELLIYSSMYSVFWLYAVSVVSNFFFFAYLFFYIVVIFFFCLSWLGLLEYLMSFSTFQLAVMFLMATFFLGVPVGSFFFFKFYVLTLISQKYHIFSMLLFFLTFFSLIGYIKFFYAIFFKGEHFKGNIWAPVYSFCILLIFWTVVLYF